MIGPYPNAPVADRTFRVRKGCAGGGALVVRVPGLSPDPILRKEVIQPQVPLRLPCYDFIPVANLTVAGCLL